MRITTVSYGQTRNLGNFQSERLDATAEVADGEDPAAVFSDLKRTILDWLHPRPMPRPSVPASTAAPPDDLPF